MRFVFFYVSFLACSFFCDQKNEPKKVFAKIMPPLRSGNFRGIVFVALLLMFFYASPMQQSRHCEHFILFSINSAKQSIRCCLGIPSGMHRSVEKCFPRQSQHTVRYASNANSKYSSFFWLFTKFFVYLQIENK